jgi:predicted DNA-binding transcriptional regulator YafY
MPIANLNILKTIKKAARERRVLRIIYVEKNGTSEGWRRVEPYSFSKDEFKKALFAWDIGKAGMRRFIIARISQAEIADSSYAPRYQIEVC